ncbi:GGDEF domain-containing protein [Castellaniella hirudinis]|uniref:diguanylate cyclase n=1 Tax=Castellaniella hirudinis TaxID=1144617 RepID=A0ABV8S0H6_9BURK
MNATIILGMLCVHLLCFCVMFLLISTRLNDRKMGTDVFAAGHLLLGLAYCLQLLGGAPGWGVMSVVNHTLTLCAPVAYVLGAIRFFDRPVPVWTPLLTVAGLYTVAQLLVQATLGTEARHALLAGSCAVLFLGMTVALLYGMRTFARDLRVEMALFSVMIGGICVLNAAKFVMILTKGLPALDMNSGFQMVFYLYMSFLGTVLPPAAVWLVLSRLVDQLRVLAVKDPLTGLLNRRGLVEGLAAHFRSRMAGSAYLLMVDIDHFKQINDVHGHQVGDAVLCRVAQTLKHTARQGDLVCRLGGEEFVVIALNTDHGGAVRLAERMREAAASSRVSGDHPPEPVRCTVTIGISLDFTGAEALDEVMQQADTALYRGKAAGRDRVEWAPAV